MTERANFSPEFEDVTNASDIDAVFQEMVAFNGLVDEMNDIPDYLKDEESIVAGGKFGQTMDFENGFGQRK